MQGIEGGMGVAGAKKKRMKNEVVINNPQRSGNENGLSNSSGVVDPPITSAMKGERKRPKGVFFHNIFDPQIYNLYFIFFSILEVCFPISIYHP